MRGKWTEGQEAQCVCLTCLLGRSNSLGALSFTRSEPMAKAAGQSLNRLAQDGSSPKNDEAHPPKGEEL